MPALLRILRAVAMIAKKRRDGHDNADCDGDARSVCENRFVRLIAFIQAISHLHSDPVLQRPGDA